MTVEEARTEYARLTRLLPVYGSRCSRSVGNLYCSVCTRFHLSVDAASIALDMANAAASDERIRKSVAWG